MGYPYEDHAKRTILFVSSYEASKLRQSTNFTLIEVMTLWALFYGSPQSLVDSFNEKILEIFVLTKLANLFYFFILRK
jgi:hypothetical protein